MRNLSDGQVTDLIQCVTTAVVGRIGTVTTKTNKLQVPLGSIRFCALVHFFKLYENAPARPLHANSMRASS